jgi:hypothetical protein
MNKLFLLLFTATVVWGCGSDEHAPAPTINDNDDDEGTGKRRVDSGVSRDAAVDAKTDSSKDATAEQTSKDAASDPSTADGAAQAQLLAPRVEILEPLAAADPNQDAVLTQAPVKVRCRVNKSNQANASAIDINSVKIESVNDSGTLKKKDTVTAGDGVFEAEFALSELKEGKIGFRCSAKDTATTAHLGSDEISTFFDPGPSIELISPTAEAAFLLTTQVRVEFKVKAVALTSSDTESSITAVTLKLAGVMIPAQQVENEPGHYLQYVNFSEATVFPDQPDGATPILITATNARSPQPATRTVNYSIIVDSRGPEITIDKPSDGQIIGGEVVLKFTIKDRESAVDPASVGVEVNDQPHSYNAPGEQWSRDSDTYSYRFDTRNVTGSKVQVTINISAKDSVGNSAGAAMIVQLDNQPPVISLDPPPVRERKKSGDKYYCSTSFDPVGYTAANDGDHVESMAVYRAVVWDLTNTTTGQTIFYYSGTNPESVFLYVQDDPNTPLLIDTNGDHICDELAYQGLPNLQMTAIAPTGNSYFGSDLTEFAKAPTVPGYDPGAGTSSYCGIEKATAPNHLCASQSSDLTRVISHRISGNKVPVVYGVNVGASTEVACTGGGWELTPFANEGWICLAARASDNVGNVGISPPLRVCLDDPNKDGSLPACQGDPPPMPLGLTCTDGCTLPKSMADLGIFNYPIDVF